MAGREFMVVNASTSNANCWSVTRGYAGTSPAPHNSGDTVYVGPTGGITSSPFINTPPAGGAGSPCLSTAQDYLPLILVGSEGYQADIGSSWTCPSSGAGANLWYQTNVLVGAPLLSDFEIFVPAGGICSATITTGTAGTGNNTVLLEGSVPTLIAISTAAAAGHNFDCNLTAALRTTTGKGVTLNSIGVVYGIVTTTATSMSTPTISYFQAPAAGTSETASSATLVTTAALVGGTLTMNPVVASANLTAASAGQFYNENIALGTPLTMNTDLRTYVLHFQTNQSASAAMTTTLAGLWLRGTQIPF